MGKKQPKAPDPAETAAAQGAWNSFTAQQNQAMNMIGQNTPWGSLDYQQTGSTTIIDPNGKPITLPQFTANVNLSPSQQAIFDQTQGAQTNLAQLANQQSEWLKSYMQGGVDTSGVPDLQSQIGGSFSDTLGDGYTTSYAGADDFSADRQRTEDALMGRMSPYFQQDEDALRTKLINQGIRPGTAAWDAEMARQSRAQDDARLGAILAGGQEQTRLVNMARDAAAFGNSAILNQFGAQNNAALQQANFNNAARAQGMNEAYAARNQPINEITALLSGSQVQSPTQSFAPTPQVGVGGVDYTGLVNQKYQSDLNNYQSGMGGLFGLGSALIGALPFSDRRLKTDITRVGTTDGGVPIYTYRYKGDGAFHMGVMAQDVPQARVKDASGYFRVDYSRVH